MSCDLHIHSTCSDGAVPIERLAPIAARTGLHAIALSDHDTLLSAQYLNDMLHLLSPALNFAYGDRLFTTFLAYYLAGCCQGQAPAQCLRAASAAAAIAITRPGAAPAIPARDEVESLLK